MCRAAPDVHETTNRPEHVDVVADAYWKSCS